MEEIARAVTMGVYKDRTANASRHLNSFQYHDFRRDIPAYKRDLECAMEKTRRQLDPQISQVHYPPRFYRKEGKSRDRF